MWPYKAINTDDDTDLLFPFYYFLLPHCSNSFLLWSRRTPGLREEKFAFYFSRWWLTSLLHVYITCVGIYACKSTLNCSVPHEVSAPSLTLHCEIVSLTEGSNQGLSVADVDIVSLRVGTIFIKKEKNIYINGTFTWHSPGPVMVGDWGCLAAFFKHLILCFFWYVKKEACQIRSLQWLLLRRKPFAQGNIYNDCRSQHFCAMRRLFSSTEAHF